MFDVDSIATLSGVSTEQVRTYLPSVLSAVRGYTNKSFITSIGISGNITISDNIITVENDIPKEITVDSQIELRYSINNTKIYTVKSISGKTITTYEKLFNESFDGFLIKLSFAGITEDLIASMINYKIPTIKYSAIKSESIGDVSYTLNVDSNNTIEGYPINLMSSLNKLRQLPESREVEYYERGFTKIPFRRYRIS